MLVTWRDIQIPNSAWSDIKQALDENPSIPLALAISVAYYENASFNPTKQSGVIDSSGPNGREDSWGYFQLYKGRLGGSGSGYTQAQLQDGKTNARIAVGEMARRYRETGSLYESIAPWTVRDTAWTAYISNSRVLVDGVPYGSVPPDIEVPIGGNPPVGVNPPVSSVPPHDGSEHSLPDQPVASSIPLVILFAVGLIIMAVAVRDT